MEIGTHNYRDRIGDNHPIVAVTYDFLLSCGAGTRADADRMLDELPPGYGTLTADKRAAVLDRFPH